MKLKPSFVIIGTLCLLLNYTHAQDSKPLISNDSYKNWTQLFNYGISPDGNYIWYVEGTGLTEKRKLILANNNGETLKTFSVGLGNPSFSGNSKTLIYNSGLDSVAIFHIKSNRMYTFSGVKDLKVLKIANTDFLIYKVDEELIIRSLSGKLEKKFIEVKNYQIAPFNKGIILNSVQGLFWLSLPDLKITEIPSVQEVSNFVFDKNGQKLAFIGINNKRMSLYFNLLGNAYARELTTDSNLDSGSSLSSVDQIRFSPDGEKIYFMVQKSSPVSTHSNGVEALTSRLEIKVPNGPYLKENNELIAVTNLMDSTGRIRYLTQRNIFRDHQSTFGNNYVLLKTLPPTSGIEAHWNMQVKPYYRLVTLKDKQVIQFIPKDHYPADASVQLSIDEKFILWYDMKTNDLFSYQIEERKIVNLTKQLHLPLMKKQKLNLQWTKFRQGIYWGKYDRFFLIFDEFDLWKIDPRGIQSPKTLTQGRNLSIRYQFLPALVTNSDVINEGQKLILGAIDEASKNTGYWTVTINNQPICKPEVMMPYAFSDSFPLASAGYGSNYACKAGGSQCFLVVKQSAKFSRNVYFTRDFKKFIQISKIEPEKKYNWMSAELINYPMLEGKMGHGLLYKPENFDPNIKYPIIFNYYQKRSDELHAYRQPELNTTNIDVAWYVSNGYVVFMPDIINDEPGRITKNIVNAAESAVKYLSKYRWLDTSKIGLNGQSFGGYETNVLATNSKLFKAAVSVCGVSDWISYAGSLAIKGSALDFTEVGQPNLGATPWDEPEIYIENSPVFQVRQSVTPLLLVHGRNDDLAVPFAQSSELYYAFRRIGKPAWFLNYLDGDHGIFGLQQETLDFTIRVQQFFNHYLKNKPMPIWMINGENIGFKRSEIVN